MNSEVEAYETTGDQQSSVAPSKDPEYDKLKPQTIAKPAITFPDGGKDAWLVLTGCFLLSFSSYGQANAFGAFTTFYVEHLLPGNTTSEISWIGSMQLVLTYFSGLALGRFFDKHGARPLLLTGCLLSVFSLMMTSLSTKYYQIFLSHGVGLGIGIALQFYPIMALPSHWFYKRRAFALGIVVAGSSLAGVIYPVMMSRLFVEVGFPWAVRTLAFFNFALQLIAIPLTKERLPKNMKLPLVDLDTLKEPIFVIYSLGGFLSAFGLFAPYWYIELYSLSKSLDPSFSFYTISIMNASGLLGRVTTGIVADKFGRFNTIVPITLLSGIFSLALWATASNLGSIVAFAILFGFTSGSISSLGVACTGQITPHPSRIGARVGIFSLFMAPGILTGPSIAGAILGAEHQRYLGLQLFVGITLVAGSALFFAARLMGLRSLGKF